MIVFINATVRISDLIHMYMISEIMQKILQMSSSLARDIQDTNIRSTLWKLGIQVTGLMCLLIHLHSLRMTCRLFVKLLAMRGCSYIVYCLNHQPILYCKIHSGLAVM